MNSRAELVISHRHSLLSRAVALEPFGLIAVLPPRYWALLWPRGEDVSSLFRTVMLPIRIVPAAVLWATSRPGRLIVAVVLATTAAVLLTR